MGTRHAGFDDHGAVGMMNCGRLEGEVGEGRNETADEFPDGSFPLAHSTHRDHIVSGAVKAGDHRVEVAVIFCVDVPTHDRLATLS